jgi:hypothetical protein
MQREETQIRAEKLSDGALAKIRDIAAAEGKTVDIENPMEKLESFFIKIVTQAREKKQRTSGAEAGTGISGFLADKPVVREETILNKLVTAKVNDETSDAGTLVEPTQTEIPEPAPDADKQLLEQLSGRNADDTALESATAESEKDEPGSAEEEKTSEVKRDILKELLGRKDDGETEITHPERNEEEPS